MSHTKKLDYLRIPFEEIKSATNSFDEKKILGKGGFGTVYKAELSHFDVQKFNRDGKLPDPAKIKSTVAIKLLDHATNWLARQQFSAEIQMLCDCWHDNIVTLLGFCEEGPQMIIVYELAVNGSLDEYLDKTYRKPSLSWVQRLRICLGAARGFEYLHDGLGNNRMIIHSDVKSSNILVDQFFVAKVADFGLSKVGLVNQQVTYVPSVPAGTPGYLDPDFLKTHKLTRKSDVFSFGVVLFEVLFGRLAYETTDDEQWFLAKSAKLHFEEGRLEEIYDPDLKIATGESFSILKNGIDMDSINTFSKIAYRCLQGEPDKRPTMAEVVTKLEEALKHQMKGVEAFRISLEEIRSATNNFNRKNLIGSGGQATVYKGELSCFNINGRSTVAIKRLHGHHSQRRQNDYLFVTEVATLFNYIHKNVMPLLGFCDQQGEEILVYRFASNGSLAKYLHGTCSLTWTQRLKICIDVAHGLHYLHDQHRITHGDVKSSDILLSHDWGAAISDFRLSTITLRPSAEEFIDPEYNDIPRDLGQDPPSVEFIDRDYIGQMSSSVESIDPDYADQMPSSMESIDPEHIHLRLSMESIDPEYIYLGQKPPSTGLFQHEYTDQKPPSIDFIDPENMSQKHSMGFTKPANMGTGNVDWASDMFSFGMVLFEVLCGRLEVTNFIYNRRFLNPMSLIYREEERVKEIVDQNIKEHSDSDSLHIFWKIAYECTDKDQKNRPTMNLAVEELEKALESQENCEWGPKLPRDYEEIIKKSKSPVVYSGKSTKGLYDLVSKGILLDKDKVSYKSDFKYTSTSTSESLVFTYEWRPKLHRECGEKMKMSKFPVVYSVKSAKGLYELLCKGILIHRGKWFSLSKEGKGCEMVSAKMFSYQDQRKTKWKTIPKSRFPKVAKILDLSNLDLEVHTQTQFLCEGITYAAYLVFRFCDYKKITNAPVFVELKYKLGKQRNSSIAYFAEWRDNGWMAIDLCHFTVQETCADFEVRLESFSRCFCGSGAIYIEGIEFLPIENVGREDQVEIFKDENVGSPLKSGLEIDWEQKLPTNYQSIIKRAENDLFYTNNQELFFLLSSGILIDKGEKFFFLSKLNGKKCHMLPATAVLCDSSNIKRFKQSPSSESRFQETVEILRYHEFRIKSNIETRMLSPNTAYACYLVYKLSEKCHGLQCPVKARNLLPRKKKETISNFYLRSPSPVNALRSTRLPVKRKDGWMEVIIWEINSEMAHDEETLPMHMKLISFGGNMSGLVIEGIEFRPH